MTTSTATFRRESLQKVERVIHCALLKQTRSSYASADGTTVVICKASRAYDDGGYWFGFYAFQLEMVRAVARGFAAFQCAGPDKLLLIWLRSSANGPTK